MNPLEKKAALTLRPYMSKDPVIVDAGSNKGDWAAILAAGAKEVHLFEPNEVLLHYSMVRFDYLNNVRYHKFGLYSEDKSSKFYYFTNVNNGLSSVYRNQKWVDMGLPMQEGLIRLTTLDTQFNKDIDFLKIDVEGADFEVLKGADRLLTEKKIRFIQVEHSEHILLSGHTWDELVNYVRSKGYEVYDFTGLNFFKATEPYTQENYYLMPEFTQDWNKEFIKNTESLKGKVGLALEIGCFEGLTSRYICDNLLVQGGRMIAIDPLPDDESQLPFGEDNRIFAGQYGRFMRNTQGYPIELIRGRSREVMRGESFRNYRFDLIYVDGDHRREEVFNDGIMSLEVCAKGGYIIFDDYEWRDETKRGIDDFLIQYADFIEVVSKGYQVVVKKINDTHG